MNKISIFVLGILVILTYTLLRAEENITARLDGIKTLLEQKETDKALEEYRALLKEYPENIMLHRSYQNVMQSLGHTNELRDEYKAKLEAEPKKAVWHYLYGRISDNTELEASFKQAIALQTDFFWPHYGLAMFYKDQQHWSEAIKEFKKAQKFNPDSIETRHNLALVYYSIGKTQDALNTWRPIVEHNPDSWEARLGMGLCLKRQADYDGAIKELTAVLAKNELFWRAYEPLIQCYYAKSDYGPAEHLIKKLKELYTATQDKAFLKKKEVIIDWQIINETCLMVATLPLNASALPRDIEVVYQFKIYYEITKDDLQNKNELPEPRQVIRLDTQRTADSNIPINLLTLRLNLLEKTKAGWAVVRTLKEYHFRIPKYQEVLSDIKKYPQ